MAPVTGWAASLFVAVAGMTLGLHPALARSGQKMTATAPKPNAPRFEPVTFADLPQWDRDDHAAALTAFLRSCKRLVQIVRDGVPPGRIPPEPALLAACEEAKGLAASKVSPHLAKTFFEQHFTPHRVVHRGPAGLVTGYYEPVIAGARQPDARFKTPVYRRPPDLVTLVDETQRAGVGPGALSHARKTEKGVEPFATREEIDGGALDGKGLELLYLPDPVDVFFMQIQGSGRIRLADGSMIRVSYDGKNGHGYTSIGRYLIDSGLFPADKVSMQGLADWLRADPERGRKVMWQNKSYVFFRELTGEQAKGALGALDIPLTPGRSLAVDAGVHALGLPVYVTASTLTHATKEGGFHRLMIAQDVGSAIKGPERGDIYFGSGDGAAKLAGVTKHAATFHVLLPRHDTAAGTPLDSAGRLGSGTPPAQQRTP